MENNSKKKIISNVWSVGYPKTILNSKLDMKKGLWADKLAQILWSYRTTAKISIGETPFSLAYGIEVMIPIEIGRSLARKIGYNKVQNEEAINVTRPLEENQDESQVKLTL